ncbi:MAG: FecR domain-containing protein [Balneola sp.]
MESQNPLPENDKDLLLAKQLDTVLQSGEGFSSIQDPLINSLLVYQNKEHEQINTFTSDSSEIWNKVLSETKPQKRAKITPLKSRRSNTWAWATAATLLIASFIGIFWFTNLNNPVLVAHSGNTIETVRLADGSQIALRPNSSLYQIEFSDTERSYQLEGEAFFVVAKDAGRPFSVASDKGILTVLGTQFNVSTWGDETTIFLEEGSVRINDFNQNSLVLKPGEQATITGNLLSTPSEADIEEFKDWLNNEIILKSTPVSKVINELEHHFKVTIDISGMQNTSEPISGTIALDDLTATLRDLGIILSGTFREVNSNSFTFIPLN